MKILILKKYLNWVIVIFALILIGGYLVISQHETKSSEGPQTDLSEMLEIPKSVPVETEKIPDKKEDVKELFVDVKGEVLNIGVYQMREGERVLDAIKRAGGFTKLADKNKVNLAALLKDEMVVYIPKIGESNPPPIIQKNENKSGKEKVNINSASKEDLEKLPGIGPSKAAAIISYRKEQGLFSKPEDLMNVAGIGERTFDHLKEFIVVQ